MSDRPDAHIIVTDLQKDNLTAVGTELSSSVKAARIDGSMRDRVEPLILCTTGCLAVSACLVGVPPSEQLSLTVCLSRGVLG